jgi:hypothetical protein
MAINFDCKQKYEKRARSDYWLRGFENTITCHLNAHFHLIVKFSMPAERKMLVSSSREKARRTESGASYLTIDDREKRPVNSLIE